MDWSDWVLEQTGANCISSADRVQTLWGGYGELWRLGLEGGVAKFVILKRIAPPECAEESESHLRKSRSYEVEQAWYAGVSHHCADVCRLARCLGIEQGERGAYILMEDLQWAGFTPRSQPSEAETLTGLDWLARFHSRFLRTEWPQLWEQGTYWHLETRREEFRRTPDGVLKNMAQSLHHQLKGTRFLTLVHGDAKTTNFCWNDDGEAAAVDFQYVGGGCGIRDVALFLDRAVGRERLQREEEHWLRHYFERLRAALREDGHSALASELVQEWNDLYPVAWTDYARFRQGWGPAKELDFYTLRQLERCRC